MKNRIFYILFLFIYFLVISCASVKIKPETTNIKLELGKIDEFVKYEKNLKSIDKTRNYFVDVSDGIYPYMKSHSFEIPKEFINKPENGIQVLKRYYYLKDGNVKMIFFEWSEAEKTKKSNRKFKKIFEKLEIEITKQLGEKSFKNLESKITKDENTFRDDIKWENSKLKAYMFRFGDNENRHNEINLAIYID